MECCSGPVVRDWTRMEKVTGSSPGQIFLLFKFKQLHVVSFFISLVFNYLCSEKVRKVIGTAKSGNGFFFARNAILMLFPDSIPTGNLDLKTLVKQSEFLQ